MAIEFGKGIALAGGFDLGAKAPLDSRLTVATIEERDAHVTGNRAYDGMLVFVEADKLTYQYIIGEDGNGEWKEFGFNEADFVTHVANDLVTDDAAKALSAAQGVTIKKLIDTEVERAEGAEEGLQTAMDELSSYVGAIPEDAEATNVIAYINEKAQEVLESATGGSSESAASVKLALDEYKALNNPKVQANTDAIEILNSDTTVDGSVDKKVADAINTFATQITDDGTINTFKEILNYISTHGGEATEIMTAIDQLETLVGNKSVAIQIAEAIEAENLAQYATDEELAEAIARIVVVEGKAHEHANATVLNEITSEKVSAWDASKTDAIAHADGEIAKVNAKIGEVAEGKTVVQLLAEMKEAAIASAEEKDTVVLASAKSYTDEKFGAIDLSGIETNATAITELQGDVAELQSVQHVEITTDEINQMFQ